MKFPNLKTVLSLALTIALLAGMLCGCQPPQESPTSPTNTTAPTDPTWPDASFGPPSYTSPWAPEWCATPNDTYMDGEEWNQRKQEMIDTYIESFVSVDAYKQNDLYDVELVYQFENAHAVYVHGPFMYLSIVRTVIVNDLTFNFPSSQLLYVYADSSFYTLQSAYQNQIIAPAELVALHEHLGAK